jgi:2-phospho-L-lactate guanylyltransferase
LKTPALLVPFKGSGYKSRLTPILLADQRKEFAHLLLRDLLKTVEGAGLERHCYVISSDPEAKRATNSVGASFILETKAKGVDSAVRLGVRKLTGRERFMVIPSDLATLSRADLNYALELGHALPFVIAPSSSFNGTNLLLFPRRMVTSLSYDNNSFWNHLKGAARLGLPTAVLTRRGLLFDLDTPADAEELVNLRTNTAAARFLRKSLAK